MPIPQHDGIVSLQAYSEARIMNGLLWLLLQNINGQPQDHYNNLIFVNF